MNRSTQQLGFTLVELMITVAIVGVALSFGVPSMRTMIETNKVAAQARSVVTALNFARSEAVTRKDDVNVIPTDGNDWSNGITVWTDADGSGGMTNNDEEILQVYDALDTATITPSATITLVRFNDDGFMSSPGAAVSFELQLENCHVDGRTITVNLTGRVDIETTECP